MMRIVVVDISLPFSRLSSSVSCMTTIGPSKARLKKRTRLLAPAARNLKRGALGC